MSLSEALAVQVALREKARFEAQERWGRTTKKDVGAEWRGSLFLREGQCLQRI